MSRGTAPQFVFTPRAEAAQEKPAHIRYFASCGCVVLNPGFRLKDISPEFRLCPFHLAEAQVRNAQAEQKGAA